MKRSVLVTGATKGIGLATAHYLNNLGYEVIGVARKNSEKPFPGLLYLADLADLQQAKSIFETIREKYSIDSLVNNVGFAKPQLIEEVSMEDFTLSIDINLRSAMQAVQVFLPGMRKQHFGRIVNITSRAVLGKVGRSMYSAAKAGLVGLTRTCALEVAQDGITVNAVAPGPINTELFFTNHPKGSEQERKVIAGLPMQRVGEPEEVAYAVEFFLNAKASFITGQTLFVDGGGSVGFYQ